MKNKKVLAVLGLAVVVAAGGTLAYFNQTHVAENQFDTGNYDTKLVETFNPKDGDDWKPGAEVNKDVEVENTGDVPVVVRAKLDETWSRDGEAVKTITSENDKSAIVVPWQADATDGLVEEDNTVVEKAIGTQWVQGTDGWFYYIDMVAPGTTTEKILDSVTLKSDVDMGKRDRTYTVTCSKIANPFDLETAGYAYLIQEDGSVDLEGLSDALGLVKGDELKVDYEDKVVEGLEGYSDADYTLTITAEVVQATDEAVDEAFGTEVPYLDLNWELEQEALN